MLKDLKLGGVIDKGGNSLENKTGEWASKIAVVDQAKCIKCHQCVIFCPEGCIHIGPDEKTVNVDGDYCKGCSVCATECPVKAISMQSKK